ncbi:MAG: AAA family ATPase [Candidatus Omnitrophota bacterium]
MYEKHWQLTEKPFENSPDPKFMYYSRKHEEALMRLMYAIKEEKGAAMLTGDYGSGKTVLSRIVIDELIKNKIYEAALITHPQLTPTQFISEIIYQLKDEHVTGSKVKLLHTLQEIFYKNMNAGKKTVMLIDEAQIIRNMETFEELRLLLNFQLNNRFLCTLVLMGQPELLPKIKAIPQLLQRLGIKYHLTGLDRNDTYLYIKHRLEVSGRADDIFTDEAIDAVFDYSKGLPRQINNVCDMCLLIGFGNGVSTVDKDLTDKVVADLNIGVSGHASYV